MEARANGIVELRNYVLVPGERERFVDYFERHFLDTQAALGMPILGQFRVLGEPDRFAWIRRFADMRSRRVALERFYRGAVWAEFGREANAMMRDSDDVYLLRPTKPTDAFLPGGPAVDGDSPPSRLAVVVCVGSPEAWPAAVRAAEAFRPERPVRTLGVLVSELERNDFPGLPVAQAEGTTVWVGAAPVAAADELTVSAAELRASDEQAAGDVEHRLVLLEPTARSPLR